MPSKPPFVKQERRDSCALACLRMLMAHEGIDVSESELLEEVKPLRGGLPLRNWRNWPSGMVSAPRFVNWT